MYRIYSRSNIAMTCFRYLEGAVLPRGLASDRIKPMKR
jgi:hypothetical protein